MKFFKTIFIVIVGSFIINGCFNSDFHEVSANAAASTNSSSHEELMLGILSEQSNNNTMYYLPDEIFYSTSGYNLNISVKLAFYGDYIASDFDYIKINPKHKPRLIGTCGHFVHKAVVPKYTILVSLGGLGSYLCSKESVKFFRKFVNYISYVYGQHVVNASQFIFLNWFSLLHGIDSDYNFSKKLTRYWLSTPKEKDVVIPAVSTAAFINKLFRIGVIPSMSDTGAYGLCIGSFNIAFASLLLKTDMKVVVLNAPAFFKKETLKNIVDNSLNRVLTTRYFLLCGDGDRYFNHKRHGHRFSKFLANYSSYVRYIQLKADHSDLIINYVYTAIHILTSVLLTNTYAIKYIKNKDYKAIPKTFSQHQWFRYSPYYLNENNRVY